MNNKGCLSIIRYARCISVIGLSLVVTVTYAIGLLPYIFPVFLISPFSLMTIMAIYSVIYSIYKLVIKEKEHICIRVADYIMIFCIAVCCLYAPCMRLYVGIRCKFVAKGCCEYVLFCKDGHYKNCYPKYDALSLPIKELGTYIQRGDSIYCSNKDTFVIDHKADAIIKIDNGEKFNIEK